MAALYSWGRNSRGHNNNGTLFECIQGASSTARPDEPAQQAATLIHSLKQSLGHLLNARPGWSQSANGFGVIDLNDVSAGHNIGELHTELQSAIREAIQHFEPRVSEVEVKAVAHPDDPLALCFHVTIQVPLPDEQQVMEFNIQLNSQKRFLVSK